MRLERSITVLAAAVLAGWLLAVLLCNGLFYRNIVNYEILYHGMAECWAQAAVRSRTGKICLLAVRVLQVAAVACITCSRLRRTGSLFLGTAIGFCGGVFFSLLVWSCGMAGGFLFLAAGFPQDLAYLPCLFLLLVSGRSDRTVQKDRFFLHHFVFAGGGDLDGALCQPADREIVLKKYNAKITTC